MLVACAPCATQQRPGSMATANMQKARAPITPIADDGRAVRAGRFWLKSSYWMGSVQLVPPVGSALISPASSRQNPRWPVLPTACGTAVSSNDVYTSWLLTVTLLQLTTAKL